MIPTVNLRGFSIVLIIALNIQMLKIVDLECRFPIRPPLNCVLRFWNGRQRDGERSSVQSIGG